MSHIYSQVAYDLPNVFDEDDHLTVTDSMACSECPQRAVDFIRQLPVQISKKIFGFLSESELFGVRLVSKHWYFLADQTRKEFILNQIASEDVMMMQVLADFPRYSFSYTPNFQSGLSYFLSDQIWNEINFEISCSCNVDDDGDGYNSPILSRY